MSIPDSFSSAGMIVTRDLSYPFRGDANRYRQALSAAPKFKDTRACCSNDETAGAVDGTPPRKFYGQKIAATVLKFLLAIKSFCRKIIQE